MVGQPKTPKSKRVNISMNNKNIYSWLTLQGKRKKGKGGDMWETNGKVKNKDSTKSRGRVVR